MSFEEDMKHHREVHTKLLEQALEDVRVDRWHATYNAALTGLHSHCGEDGEYTVEGAHARARNAANLAHGALSNQRAPEQSCNAPECCCDKCWAKLTEVKS